MTEYTVLNYNPYSYNSVALKNHPIDPAQIIAKRRDLPSPTMALLNPNANFIARWIGVDVTHDWSKDYPQVWKLYQWAVAKTKSDDLDKHIEALNTKLNTSPSLHSKRLMDLYLAIELEEKSQKPPVRINMVAPNEEVREQVESLETTEEQVSEETTREEVES